MQHGSSGVSTKIYPTSMWESLSGHVGNVLIAGRVVAGATETTVSWSGDNLASMLKSPLRGLDRTRLPLGRNLDKRPGWDATRPTFGDHSSHGTCSTLQMGALRNLPTWQILLVSHLEINPVIVATDSLFAMSDTSRSFPCLSSNQQQRSCSVDGNTSSAQHSTRRFATFEWMFSAASADPRTGRPSIDSN